VEVGSWSIFSEKPFKNRLAFHLHLKRKWNRIENGQALNLLLEVINFKLVLADIKHVHFQLIRPWALFSLRAAQPALSLCLAADYNARVNSSL
jgi:hypothetical protein